MKIKLDENLPLRLAILLKELGHDVHTLQDELLDRIWGRCLRMGSYSVT